MTSTETLTQPSEAIVEDDFLYRPLSAGAIASAVLGVLSLLVFLAGRDSLQSCLMMCPIPVVSLAVGLHALRNIRSLPDQLSGGKLARFGVVMSAFCLIGGLGYSSYVYSSEVPDGYVRTSFTEMRPDQVEVRTGELVPPELQQLDGQRVFIKGYMRADSTPVRYNVQNFLLVRDNQQCCFGDLSKVKHYDQVLVNFVGRLNTDYSPKLYRMGGILRVHPENIQRGVGHPVYTLEADYVK